MVKIAQGRGRSPVSASLGKAAPKIEAVKRTRQIAKRGRFRPSGDDQLRPGLRFVGTQQHGGIPGAFAFQRQRAAGVQRHPA